MPRLTASVTIAAPPEAVFSVLESPGSPVMPQGGPRLVRLSPAPGVGAAFRWEYRRLGMTFAADSVVTEYRPERLMAYRGTRGWEMEAGVELHPVPAGTRLEFRIRYRFPAPLRWILPGPLIRLGIWHGLRWIKEAAEASLKPATNQL